MVHSPMGYCAVDEMEVVKASRAVRTSSQMSQWRLDGLDLLHIQVPGHQWAPGATPTGSSAAR